MNIKTGRSPFEATYQSIAHMFKVFERLQLPSTKKVYVYLAILMSYSLRPHTKLTRILCDHCSSPFK